jgi:hypothetical protein
MNRLLCLFIFLQGLVLLTLLVIYPFINNSKQSSTDNKNMEKEIFQTSQHMDGLYRALVEYSILSAYLNKDVL